MGIQKNQKGRFSAAQETEQLSRRKQGARSHYRGAQQFGGVAPEQDSGSAHLSSRARRALDDQGSPKKKAA